ncbi:helix-turn-helix domain-containing protein [Salipaludibacillus daqingensis]|uniref:helix-turn-helix domain-containing protein n=1 Tax=Salipaludibacillus daqingensis TaxID=3041001 RepID=UPI002476C2FB|nr:helix-turn-helix domain-containing protein [Salipaludibacillus daqingensis]
MDFQIGHKIKELRTFFNISQSELSKGICTQALISQIESGETLPSAEILYHISTRLGTDMNFFFTITETPSQDYARLVLEDLDNAVRHTKYEEVLSIVKVEKKNPLFQQHPQLQQTLLWREAICTFHLHLDLDKALMLIDQALDLRETTNKNLSVEEMKILNSKAILLSQSKQTKEANRIIDRLLEDIKTSPLLKNPRIAINICYNGSKISVLQGKITEAIKRAEQGIKLCLKHEELYLLGELFYQNGQSLYLKSDENGTASIKLMEDALWIFDRTENKPFYDLVEEEINHISEKIKKAP